METTQPIDLSALNARLSELGLLPLALVAPNDCREQPKNARYMSVETKNQLIANVKAAGHLESVPLVCSAPSAPGKYDIISGHHRVEAAKAAGLQQILVLIATPKDKEEITSKQLAHNAIVGIDDVTIRAELLDSIKDLQLRLATGLNDAAAKIQYVSLNFRGGNFKVFTIAFLPAAEEAFDAVMEQIAQELVFEPKGALRLTGIEYFDRFAAVLRRVKKAENIKSNGVAFERLVELAQAQLKQLNESQKADEETSPRTGAGGTSADDRR